MAAKIHHPLLSAIAGVLLTAGIVAFSGDTRPEKLRTPEDKKEKFSAPYDWFVLQRSYPDATFAEDAYVQAIETARRGSALSKKAFPGFEEEWRLEGPTNIGGRVNDIAIHPADKNIMYAGAASGGLFRTTDGGKNWSPLFDQQAYLAIGSIAIDAAAPQTIYLGTGDPNISGYPAVGNGVYKSVDGGDSWVHLGLAEEKIIAEVAIDPSDSKVIYAAAMGTPFERNDKRGLYRSTNGGQDWTRVLYVNDETGISDVAIDPSDPQTLYAASWTRIRTYKESLTATEANKIYKSTDGGQNWTLLTNGLPAYRTSRIGLAISHNDPDRLYAVITDSTEELEGVYQTTNGGQSWNKLPVTGLDQAPLGGFGWYFGKIWINPADDNDIYLAGVDLWQMDVNNGVWERFSPPWYLYTVHADKHAMQWIDNNTLILGSDGGLNTYRYDTKKWTQMPGLPITQFYHVAVRPHGSRSYFGGAQDNGTLTGNATSKDYWLRIYGGDGFKPVFHPEDKDIYYVEVQNGDVYSYSNGSFDYCTYFLSDTSERRNWDMPYIMSHHDPDRLYCGTYRIHRNTSGTLCDWSPLSPDLTKGDLYGARYHTISTVAESPRDEKYLFAGTSDGLVWKSTDAGGNWIEITTGLPDRYVTDIKPSYSNKDVVYVSHSGYRYNDPVPHLHRSDDLGKTWTDISGDLPPTAVNRIWLYPENDSIIFVATDAGVYGSTNAGVNWERLGSNMPFFPVYDIAYDSAENVLLAGTFARSMMSYPMDSIIIKDKNNHSSIAAKAMQPYTFETYPNPVADKLVIKGTSAAERIEIYDMKGRRLLNERLSGRVGTFTYTLNIAHLPKGTYLLHVFGKEGRTASRKVLKI